MAAPALLLFHSPVERWSGFVRLVLEEKELDYDTNIVNSLVCENLQPWYLRDLNDTGELPTLVHKNKVVTRRLYIARYLDRQFRTPPLVPNDETLAAQVDLWLQKAEDVPDPTVCSPAESPVRNWLGRESLSARLDMIEGLADANADLQEPYDHHIGLLDDTLDILSDPDRQRAVEEQIEAQLDEVEQALRGSQYVVGNTYTLADAAWTAVARDLESCRLHTLWEGGRRRAFAKWYRRMKSRPSFEAAYMDHPVTLDMVLSLWRIIATRLLFRTTLGSSLLGLGVAIFLARRFMSWGRVPGPDAPIMITF